MKWTFFLLSILFVFDASGEIREYDLEITYKHVYVAGKGSRGMAVNGTIPGPTLRFKEGDTAKIHVTNKMDVNTSVHWHGLLLPNRQDGVPYLTTPPIAPGATLTYEFPLIQAGTYWYHSHTGLQEQIGVHGSIVIEPNEPRTDIEAADEEHVLVLSDWTNENPNEILRTLKRGSDYYSFKKGSMQTVVGILKNNALGATLKRSFRMMPPADVSDIAYDAFEINGEIESSMEQTSGKTVKLRIINSAASTYFYLQFAGGDMEIVASDGLDVVPVKIDRMLIAVAETYDVLIRVPENGAYEFRATAQDGSGHTSMYFGKGERVLAPSVPKPNIYKMSMASMSMDKKDSMHNSEGSEHMGMEKMEMGGRPPTPYKMLKSLTSNALPPDRPTREVVLNLTGDMERYVWSLNGKTLKEEHKIKIKKGENVRFILVNKTMMNHPMHLHGHFFRVANRYGDYAPMKHTVDVPPFGKVIMEFEANEEKDWFFHCHVLYHMAAGMARVVSYEGSEMDPDIKKIRPMLYKDPIYVWGDMSLMSQMSTGAIVVSNTHNTLSAEWQSGWEDAEYEIDLTYTRYINRFISPFIGAELTNGDQVNRGFAGFDLLLPFLIDTSTWIDWKGDVRIQAVKEIQLTNRLSAFADVQYDTKSEWELQFGGEILINKQFSLTGGWHSEYGAGGGIMIRF